MAAQPASLFDRAVALQRSGDLDGARSVYEQLLSVEPTKVEALANLGAIFLRLNQPAEAVKVFRRAVELKPAMLEIRFFAGLARFQAGDPAGARTELEWILNRSPRDPRALYLDALCLLRLDRLTPAIDRLELAIAAEPRNTAAQLTLASTLVSVGELTKAEALAAGPLAVNAAAADLIRGSIANARGQYRDAEAILRKAAQADPKLATVHNQLGYSLMLLGDSAAAVREFEAELRISPNDFQASANLAWVLVQDREFAQAAPLLDRALQEKPHNPGLLYLRGQVWSAEGDWARAAASLEQAVQYQPNFRAARVLLARTYARQGRSGDVARERAAIAKLEAEEQERNVQLREGYGASPASKPDFAPNHP